MKGYCLKDLKFETGEVSFKKGKAYKFAPNNKDEGLYWGVWVINEQGEQHQLGEWYRFFCFNYAYRLAKKSL